MTELACVRCGYVLRGQRPGDRCPECGAGVRETLDAQRLGSWPRPWLRRLRLGLGLLLAAVGAGWLAVFAFSVTNLASLSYVLPALDSFRGLRLGRYAWAVGALFLVSFGLAVWGTAAVTFSEAARVVGGAGRRPTRLARAGVVVAVAGFVAVCAALLLTRGRWQDRLVWTWLALFVGAMVAVWNLCTCLARLARRIPDEPLARRCQSFRWLALGAALLELSEASSFWAVVTWLPARSQLTWWRTIAVVDTLVLAGRLSVLAAGALAIRLLWRYSRRLGDVLGAESAG